MTTAAMMSSIRLRRDSFGRLTGGLVATAHAPGLVNFSRGRAYRVRPLML